MKSFVFLTLACAALVAGCASSRQNQFSHAPAAAARVVSFNPVGRFVVLNFPVGELPGIGDTLSLYRAGLKVGEVQVTGPQRNTDIVADLVTGEAQVGDEVRQP